MNQRTLFMRVGAMLAGSAIVLVVLVLTLTGDQLGGGRAYETYFSESVQGLDIGAPVKYRGVTLGHVTGIGLVSAEYGTSAEEQIVDEMYRLIVVRFKINPKLLGKLPDTETAVRSGLRAKLANQGLTGVMFVELDFAPPEQHPYAQPPWTPLDDFIPSVPSTIAQVQDEVTQLLHKFSAIDVNGITRNVDGLITDLRHTVSDRGNVGLTLAQARSALADVRDQINKADLPALSAQLRRTGAAVETLSQGRQTRALLDTAEADLQRLPPLIAALQQTTNRAGAGVADIQSELIPILEDVRAAVANLRETTESIRRDPGSVLQQGAPPKDQPKDQPGDHK
jgi:ABC-type transporter Mla subunit MlaD